MKKNLFKKLFIYVTENTLIKFLIYLKYEVLGDDKGECKVPDSVIDSISRLILPDIQAFFESEKGLKAYEEWKAEKPKAN